MTTDRHETSRDVAAVPERLLAAVGDELSPRTRAGYAAALLGSLVVSGAVATLWATEPALPARTQVAFGLVVALGLTWVAATSWVLTRRRPLYATDRVVVLTLAVVVTTVTSVASAAVATMRVGAVAGLGAATVGLAITGAATALLVQARRRRAALLARRDELAARLSERDDT